MAVAKNNVDYFPFLCKEGKTLRYIDGKYGNDGFATWVRLLRELAITDFHYLNLKEEHEFSDLSVKFKVTEEFLSLIISDLCQRDEIHANLWEKHRIIFSVKFIDSIQDAYKQRKNKCVTLETLTGYLIAEGIIKVLHTDNAPLQVCDTPVLTQSKEENSKEEERREEQSSAQISGNGFVYEFSNEVPREAHELTEKILDYFSASKDVMSPIFSKVENFIAMVFHRGDFEKLKTAFEKYKAYKARSNQEIHGLEKWMGTIDEYFKDGHWYQTDWDAKLKNLPVKPGSTQPIKKFTIDQLNQKQ